MNVLSKKTAYASKKMTNPHTTLVSFPAAQGKAFIPFNATQCKSAKEGKSV